MVKGVPDAFAGRTSGPEVGLFRREGRYWTLELAGQRTCLPDYKGLRALAILLSEPRRRFYALHLVHMIEPPDGPAAAHRIDHPHARIVHREAALGPRLDERALREYREKIESLREQSEDANACNDSCRAALLQEELRKVAEQLSSALGLGGRNRPAGDCDERARQKIRKNIKAALDAIHETHAALGRHVIKHVRTGRYCWYEPDPDHPIEWTL